MKNEHLRCIPNQSSLRLFSSTIWGDNGSFQARVVVAVQEPVRLHHFKAIYIWSEKETVRKQQAALVF